MSKVLFINNYREGTGYSNAGIDFILALDKAGVDVVPKHLTLSGEKHEVPARIIELEKKKAKGCDVVIQYTLPHLMHYNGDYKNIGIYDYETDCINFKWNKQLSLMDRVFITNQYSAKPKNSNVAIIPHTSDINKYMQCYEPFDIPHLKNKFVFYFIGELSKRKNLEALLKAFHLEFKRHEDVELLLKVNVPGLSQDETRGHIDKYCEEIKRGMKIYDNVGHYKKEVIMPQRLSNYDIMRLHSTCNCFVTAAYGEGWCKPAFDAMAMGRTPIVVADTIPFITSENDYLCEYQTEPCFGVVQGFKELYTSRENWKRVSIDSLRANMRIAFEENRQNKIEIGLENSLEYSYENVGKQLKELIDE